MNIFVLHQDPKVSAEHHCDKHVVSQIKETAQMLATAYDVCDVHLKLMPEPTHEDHPCNKWIRASTDNYRWTFRLFKALLKEYTYRYEEYHKYEDLDIFFEEVPEDIPRGGLTKWALAMPDIYKHDNVIAAYRRYYYCEKRSFARWNKGQDPPDWWYDSQYHFPTYQLYLESLKENV